MAIKINGETVINDNQRITITGMAYISGEIVSPTITALEDADTTEADARTAADLSLLISLTPYVTIASQKWMAENLNVSHYRDGTPILTGYTDAEWGTLSIPAYSSGFEAIYGKLYNWYTIQNGENNHEGICPEGYHVPSDAEWTILTDTLGGESVAGGKMKAMGEHYWNSPNEGADNISNFSGLPAGSRVGNSGLYWGEGNSGSFWSSTENSNAAAVARGLNDTFPTVTRFDEVKETGLSIRCIAD